VLLERLMRWCQVGRESDLPPIYGELANTKKGKVRLAIQTAVEDALATLKYVEDFPVSTSLATKLQELKWHSPLTENLSTGVNIFCLGSLEEESMEKQRQLNQHADALYGGDAAPSLLDIVAVQDTKHEVCIPKRLPNCATSSNGQRPCGWYSWEDITRSRNNCMPTGSPWSPTRKDWREWLRVTHKCVTWFRPFSPECYTWTSMPGSSLRCVAPAPSTWPRSLTFFATSIGNGTGSPTSQRDTLRGALVPSCRPPMSPP